MIDVEVFVIGEMMMIGVFGLGEKVGLKGVSIVVDEIVEILKGLVWN